MFELDRILFMAVNATHDTPHAVVRLAIFSSNTLPWLALCTLSVAYVRGAAPSAAAVPNQPGPDLMRHTGHMLGAPHAAAGAAGPAHAMDGAWHQAGLSQHAHG